MAAGKASAQDILDWVKELKGSDIPVLVEGKKDKAALESLGISNIITLKKPLYLVVEKIASEHNLVIILTDFDKKGKELYGKLKKDLLKHGVRIDNQFREFLQKNTQISHIEGIRTYIDNLDN
ncbi:toprim domain-containing protein [Candidatus Woesearchaeota archaeon]|nr:toprim domain-containing protein [Candidatus Woesearchaeota archaeon]